MKSKILTLQFLFIFLILSSLISYSQTNIKLDSLQKLLAVSKSDSDKVILQIKILYQYLGTDSAQAKKTLDFISQTLKYSEIKSKSKYYYKIGKAFENANTDFENAIKYFDTATVTAKAENDNKWVVYERWLGYTYSKTGESELALKHVITAVEFAENNNMAKELPMSYILLAFVYREIRELQKAKYYFSKSIDCANKVNDSTYIHTALHEIGNIYIMQRDFVKAIEFQKKALVIRERSKKIGSLMYSYHDIGIEYLFMDSIDQSYRYLLKAKAIAEQTNERWMMLNIYKNICIILDKKNNISEEKKYLEKMRPLAYELNVYSSYYSFYRSAYDFYKQQNQYDSALYYYELSELYNDSISNEDVKKNIGELDKKYETAKKDKELIENQSHIKHQQIIIWFVAVGLVVVLGFMILVIRQYRQKRAANIRLEIQNQEILQQKEEILAQAENLEQANSEISHQKAIIEKSHEQITASITYAKRIQEAVLPKSDLIEMLFPNHFVLYLPRDVVSGDFYFVKPYKQFIFIGVADCTGHGVPGAFMSMLGVALLNELVRKPEISTAAALLDELRSQIKNSLQQTGQFGEQQDGMDIAFAVIDLKTSILNFAGAYNPLIIIRNHQIIELKADKMPVGIYRREQAFTNQYFNLQDNDILYLFSDGYYSQFHHNTKMPMRAKVFKDLLAEIHTLEFAEQKTKLETFLKQWKGEQSQVDDILIVGIKI